MSHAFVMACLPLRPVAIGNPRNELLLRQRELFIGSNLALHFLREQEFDWAAEQVVNANLRDLSIAWWRLEAALAGVEA